MIKTLFNSDIADVELEFTYFHNDKKDNDDIFFIEDYINNTTYDMAVPKKYVNNNLLTDETDHKSFLKLIYEKNKNYCNNPYTTNMMLSNHITHILLHFTNLNHKDKIQVITHKKTHELLCYHLIEYVSNNNNSDAVVYDIENFVQQVYGNQKDLVMCYCHKMAINKNLAETVLCNIKVIVEALAYILSDHNNLFKHMLTNISNIVNNEFEDIKINDLSDYWDDNLKEFDINVDSFPQESLMNLYKTDLEKDDINDINLLSIFIFIKDCLKSYCKQIMKKDILSPDHKNLMNYMYYCFFDDTNDIVKDV